MIQDTDVKFLQPLTLQGTYKKQRKCSYQHICMTLLIVLVLAEACFAAAPEIVTESGKIIGSTVYYKDIPVKRFLGIPYAEPPVGHLRFRKTVPVQPWTGTLAANDWSPVCIQYYPVDYSWIDNASEENEDCLYLNVWVPETGYSNQPKAVMFWIHGGCFIAGSTRLSMHDGYVLAAEGDVIVVTINHRLGIFGFLSTEDESAPGNMGLYDILEAFKWTRNNIEAFGGDKNRITVFGHSAGSLATAYFAISPLTKGLLQRIILLSGAPSDKGDSAEKNSKLGENVASAAGCTTLDKTLKTAPEEVVECLRGIPADILHQKELLVHPTATRGFMPIYGDEFLPEKPTDAIVRGEFNDVSAMAGNVKDEGSIAFVHSFSEITGIFGEKYPQINKTYGEDIILKALSAIDDPRDIANHYLSGVGEYDYDAVRRQVYHAVGDFNIFCPQLYLSEKLSSSGKDVYFFYLYHRILSDQYAEWTGANHMTPVPLVFGRPLVETFVYTEPEGRLSGEMIRLCSNFAKYGVPSLDWMKFSKYQPCVQRLHIYDDPDDYLAEHLENCNFLRKYFGFS